jgi:hypothetical protein
MSDEFKRGEKVRALQESDYWGNHWHNAIIENPTMDGRYVVRWDYTGARPWPAKAAPRPITGIVDPENIKKR